MSCGSGLWVVGLVVMAAFLIGVVLLVVWSVRQLAGGQGPRPDSPEEILRRRFAAGEISQADYEQAKRTLGVR